jgi:hypothetical protein
MVAKPGQPVDEDGTPVFPSATNSTIPTEEDDVLGHVADLIPPGEEPGPKLAL